MPEVRIGSEIKTYPQGTAYAEIAEEYQKNYENDILLVSVNGRLRELHKTLQKDCQMEFITAADTAGYLAYQRSAVFLMMKAFQDVAGRENVKNITVCFSVENGLYVEVEGGVTLSQELLDRVKEEMKRLSEQDLPLQKRSENTDEAMDHFQEQGMYDKARLFNYRRASRVNVYRLGDYDDYFYGYMVMSTRYLKYFDLQMYEEGFILRLPNKKQPKAIQPFHPQKKLFDVQQEAEKLGHKLGVFDVGTLNDTIARGRMNDLILMQEALQEKNIGQVAEKAVKDPDRRIVMIAGPSSSGKTTFSHRLSTQFAALGYNPHPISVDNYFRNREEYPLDENGQPDFEALGCVDIPQFNEDMNALLSGKTIELPRFNFKTGKREYKGEMLKLGKKDILVIEGIHCLNDAMSSELPKDSKFKIYISALTQLNVDEHNRIPTTDGRLIRRMVRDARTRGTSALETIERWPSVRRGEDKNIFPYQESADVMFNSALVYELAVLKLYAEPLLFNIPRDREEYDEAKRLLKFLDYFLAIDSDVIPKTSILREFIGGSCLNV
mgnify:CR=1 FL=1